MFGMLCLAVLILLLWTNLSKAFYILILTII